MRDEAVLPASIFNRLERGVNSDYHGAWVFPYCVYGNRAMQDIIDRLRAYPPFQGVEAQLHARGPCRVEGLWGSSAPMFVAALATGYPATMLCLLPSGEEAETFVEDISTFASEPPLYFPAWETLENDEIPDADILSLRLGVLKWLFAAERGAATENRVIVAPVQAVLQPVPPPRVLAQNTLPLNTGVCLPPEEIIQWLTERGFQHVRCVEVPGEFCRRGGILDIFPYGAEEPVRIEFFGDDVESLRSFDPGTQSSTSEIKQTEIAAIPRRIMGEITGQGEKTGVWSSLFDHLPKDALLVLKEPADMLRLDRRPPALTAQDAFNACHEALRTAAAARTTLHLASLPGIFSKPHTTFHVHSVERFGGDLDSALRELKITATERDRTIVLCGNSGEEERFKALIAESALPEQEKFEIRIGRLNHGFDWADLSLAVLPHHDLLHRYRQRRTIARYRHTRAIDTFYDLNPGDLVVHTVHGIGIFRGMELLKKGRDMEECLHLEYADQTVLYVPASRIELVQKYIGPSTHRPPLSKLGARGWLKRKQKTQEAVHDVAAELLRLQAVRKALQGIAHPPDNDWQRDFESSFPYEETQDQLRVAVDVKDDMSSSRPMDRLICGDVGYGKTEIAMRAAFKAVMGGRQVAVLVPTTILAAQHTQTFSERMADYPVVIEMLSRFRTHREQVDVVSRLVAGRVDIVIGTHRLVQSDVHFKDLGLVIIDEEQRFGVEHKERLKRFRETVDVLTLTATPIPRTLHMSLLGMRDIASLETPPRDRLAIHTRLMRFDPRRVRQAILHEMSRGGQVFFLHNRVQTIEHRAGQLRKLMPEARILVGHGQMPEKQLATVMHDFVENRADVLVCTTIIESGLDIPNANTIIIDRADMFGLAELHQLRGRVGRYKHRAYAYLLLPEDRPVTPIAETRLKAIEEFCELGAGFRIAMRDLEIRGAGNILGPEQSGHIAAVGYDMYCRILQQTVRALKHEPEEGRPEVAISIGLTAFLPETYVPDPAQRIELYRKLQRAARDADTATIREEMCDRFGELPPETVNLLTEAHVRILAAHAGITSMVFHNAVFVCRASDPDNAYRILSAGAEVVRRIDEHTLHLHPEDSRASGEILLSFLKQTLERGLAAINPEPAHS